MVHLSGEDFPIFEGYPFQLEEALFPVLRCFRWNETSESSVRSAMSIAETVLP
jgi:hypothetical protein